MKITSRIFAVIALTLLGLYSIFSQPQHILLVVMGGTMLGVALVLILMELKDANLGVNE